MTTQDREFKTELRQQLKRRPAIQRETYAEVKRLLEQALTQIKATLAGAPTDWEQYYLPQLQQSIRQALTEFGQQAATAAASGSNQSWQAGVDLIDKPLQAGGVAIVGMIPQVDTAQLTAMRTFLTDKIGGIGIDLIDKINTQLGLTAIGAQSTGQAVSAIEKLLDQGGRSRALTILRTELGRAYSTAAQQRMTQASEVLPGLKKQWRRSGKLHSRVNHDYIDGQIQPVDQPFNVGTAKLMYPRDPKGPAKETINCGCESLPWMEHWQMENPGRKPFTEQEIGLSKHKQEMAAAFGGTKKQKKAI